MNRTLAILTLTFCPALWSAQFFVAPNGNDAATGARNAPFGTLGRARDAVRSAKSRGPVEVIVRAGTYYLPTTLLLEPRDSGTAASPVVYRAQEGERVVLSGGLRIAGPWRSDKDGIWSAEVPAALKNENIRQLFVNGRREIRARYPNAGDKPAFLFAQGGDKEAIRVDLGAAGPHWEAAEGAEVNVVPEWRFFNQWQTISGFDRASGTLRLRGEEPHGRIIAGSWFFIEGSRAELDQAREWVHDRAARRLYYKPENGADPNRLEIVVPRLNAIVQLKGDPEAGTQVEHVQFLNLEFHHTTYTLGHIEARVQTEAAVMLTNASRNRIERCRFVNSGGYGIWLHLDSRDNVIDGNEITEGGAGGVLLTSARLSYQDDSKLYTPGPGAAKAAPLGNRITGNHIHHCGRIRYYCSGVHLDSRPAATALMAGNYVAHNHLHHLSRNGIFAFRNQGGNIFEYNRIEEIMRDTEDGGAVHVATMNQLAAPNVIRNNLIANVWGWRQLPTGEAERHIARGVYLDWFSASTLSENNIVYNTITGGLQFNAGDDNHFLNNVVVGDGTAWNTRWQKANAQGTRDERNLIIKDPVAKSPFENAAAGDFRLRKDFPGYPEGFNWIDASQIGPSGTVAGTIQLASLAREGGVVNYDQAMLQGTWKRETGTGFWGLFLFKYVVAAPADDASATFTLPISRDGLYDIRLSFPALPGNADQARFEIVHVDGSTLERIDMSNFGYWPRLGRYRFRKDRPARVILRAADAGGQVVIEALGFVRVAD